LNPIIYFAGIVLLVPRYHLAGFLAAILLSWGFRTAMSFYVYNKAIRRAGV